MPLEYLSGNELLKYPFKDSVFTYLPNDVFADAVITFKQPDMFRASLYGIGRFGNNVELSLNVYDISDQLAYECTFSFDYTTAVRFETYAFNNAGLTARFVIGKGFVDYVASITNETTITIDRPFDPSAVFLHVPRVKQISFYTNEDLETVIEGDELTETTLELAQGSNIDFQNIKNQLSIDVIPGAGTGLYNPCPDDLVIKTINNTPGDPVYSNFTFLTDGCYNVSRGNGEVADFGLQFENICTPKCTATQLGAFAHYLNRVKSGMMSVAEYAASIYNDLEVYIANFNATTLPASRAPYIKSAITSFDNGYGGTRRSIVVAFYNRSPDGAVSVSATVSGGNLISSFYRCGSYTHTLNARSCSESLPCLQYGRFELTLNGSGPFTVSANAGTTSYSKVYS